jgi:hypothetical protein
VGNGAVTIQWATPAPAVTLASNLDPSIVGNSLTFTATVQPLNSGGPAPTGTVQIVDLTTGFPVGLPQVLPGSSPDSVSATVNDLSVGSHNLVAAYAGDSSYLSSESALLLQTVRPLAPTLSHFTPKRGKAGQPVTIFGTNLASASRVSFDGTPAPPITDVSGEITIDVPVGAHSGAIQVTTPGGTVTSAKKFRV